MKDKLYLDQYNQLFTSFGFLIHFAIFLFFGRFLLGFLNIAFYIIIAFTLHITLSVLLAFVLHKLDILELKNSEKKQ